MSFPTRSRYTVVSLVLILILVLPVAAGFGAQNVTARASEDKVTIANYELIGTTSIPTGTLFEGTEIGGLSSITYDSNRGVYYAISEKPHPPWGPPGIDTKKLGGALSWFILKTCRRLKRFP